MRATLLLPVLLLTLAAGTRAQTTWYVDPQGTPPGNGSPASPYTSIQYAHDQQTTVHGDTLLLAPGTYVENLVLTKHLSVLGAAGPEHTLLRGAAPGIVVYIPNVGSPLLFLQGLTIDGSGDPSGKGIHICCGTSAEIVLDHCVIQGFTSGEGIFSSNAYVTAFHLTVAHNAVGIRMSPAVHYAMVFLDDSILRGNSSDYLGWMEQLLATHTAILPGLSQTTTGNISDPPRFWNLEEGDLHLKPGSPLIAHNMGALPFDPTYAWGPVAYCEPKTSSLGCAPSVSWSGSANASGGQFLVQANDVLSGVAGVAIYSLGNLEQPFQGGTLCVTPPVVRAFPQLSGGNPPPLDCSGTLQFDFDAWTAGGVHPELGPGQLLYLQFWYRDPGDAFGSGLSDAVGFGVAF